MRARVRDETRFRWRCSIHVCTLGWNGGERGVSSSASKSLSEPDFLTRPALGERNNGLFIQLANMPLGRRFRERGGGLTYFPLIFQPGSSLSSFSAISSPLSPSPTTTSLLTVLNEQILGAPAALAIGPIATGNGVLAGA